MYPIFTPADFCLLGGVLIGTDLLKDRDIIRAAYNDSQGVTAAFNLNLLVHINAELGADFDLKWWAHRAVFNESASRIEMHLVSLQDQTVHVGDSSFEFAKDAYILSEYSHKWSLAAFREMASAAGLELQKTWADDDDYFAVHYLTPTRRPEYKQGSGQGYWEADAQKSETIFNIVADVDYNALLDAHDWTEVYKPGMNSSQSTCPDLPESLVTCIFSYRGLVQ